MLYTVSFYFQERELEGAQESGNVNVLAKEIDKLQTDKREVDNELRRLREEQQAMHMQSTTQAKLDMLSGQRKEQQRGSYSENVREINPFVWRAAVRPIGSFWFHLAASSHVYNIHTCMCAFSMKMMNVCSVDSRRKSHKKYKMKLASVDRGLRWF